MRKPKKEAVDKVLQDGLFYRMSEFSSWHIGIGWQDNLLELIVDAVNTISCDKKSKFFDSFLYDTRKLALSVIEAMLVCDGYFNDKQKFVKADMKGYLDEHWRNNREISK